MATNIDYLIPVLRLELGDINPAAYRYTDEWLSVALIVAVKSLQRWWDSRYLVDATDTIVSRNPLAIYTLLEPPVIESSDDIIIILMADYIIQKGSLESSAWTTSTWRDAEYYVSNVEGAKLRDAGLKRIWDRLMLYIKSPQQRLNVGSRESFDFGADETT